MSTRPPRIGLAALVTFALLSPLPPPGPAGAAERAAPSKRAARPPAAAAARPLTADDLKGLSWRSIGPANMGGRVAALALIPGSRTSFYVGYATGGLFRTDNLGTTFTPVFDEHPVLSIGSVAVADAPPGWSGWAAEEAAEAVAGRTPAASGKDDAARGKGKIVWVGTGEGNGRNSSSWGGGVYRSTDAGGTFTWLGLKDSHDIPALAVDPRNPDVAYVAALGHLWGANPERGLYRTPDGGTTWSRVLGSGDQVGACEVAIDPQRPDTVYAGLYARRRTPWSFSGYSDQGGLYRSDDAGRTWKKLSKGLPPRAGRIGLTIYPKDPRILYAVVESDYGGTGRDPFDNWSISGGLFRSEDRGETWTRTTNLNFRPFYFSRVAVDPEDDRRVYLPGWDLAISDDGGRTFRGSGSQYVHVDFHAIVVNPADRDQILVGNDGGVYVSHDRARTWDYLNNVAAGQFYRIAVDGSDPYRVAGGLQDNGSWIGPSQTGGVTDDDRKDGIFNDDWRMIYGGDGFTVAFDPLDPALVYATSQGADLGRVRLDTQAITYIKPVPREGQERFRFNWNAPYLISQHDPSVLYLGGNRVFRLTERGDLWFAISPDLSRNEPGRTATVGSDAETYGTVVSLAESALQKGLLWAGTDDGRVHLTRDDGARWSEVTPREVRGLYVSRIAASRHRAGTAYVAVDGHRSDRFDPILLATDDFGRTWRSITGDLPDGDPIEVVLEDPGHPDVLYAGTEFGLYLTVERGARWVRLNGKTLPPAPVDDLVIHPRERDLLVGTHGRSIYVLDDASMFAQLTPALRQRPLALLAMRPATPRLFGRRSYGVGHGIFRARNPPMGATINYWLREDTGDPVKITVTSPAGEAIRELEGSGRAGLNRVVWDLQADEKHRIPTVEARFLDQTQFVPAGEYAVSLARGKEKDGAKVTVRPFPSSGGRNPTPPPGRGGGAR
ncbi:MAG: WD40/YVTN/BNR-like repeat-containing protein [Candidatus Polarisedimenticolia bacterium]